MGRPKIDPKKKKVPGAHRLSQWLDEKAKKHAKMPGNDNISVQIEKALIYYHQWEEPK